MKPRMKRRIKKVKLSGVVHVHHPKHVVPVVVAHADKGILEIAPVAKKAIKKRTWVDFLFR